MKIEKVRHLLEEKQLDAVVILSPYNRRYLSGFTGSSAGLIITKEKVYLLQISDIWNKQRNRRNLLKS